MGVASLTESRHTSRFVPATLASPCRYSEVSRWPSSSLAPAVRMSEATPSRPVEPAKESKRANAKPVGTNAVADQKRSD